MCPCIFHYCLSVQNTQGRVKTTCPPVARREWRPIEGAVRAQLQKAAPATASLAVTRPALRMQPEQQNLPRFLHRCDSVVILASDPMRPPSRTLAICYSCS
jgi:hypothetical protein